MSDITLLCELKPHFRNYLEAKLGSGIGSEEPIEISQRNFLGKTIRVLLAKTPKHPIYPAKEKSLLFQLPHFHGLNVCVYNYLSSNSQAIIQRKVREVFFLELHSLIIRGTRRNAFTQKECIYFFMERYELFDHITFDALKRSYYRFVESEIASDSGRELVAIFNQVSSELFA